MPTRRGSHTSHVRPRPPSTGRPTPQRVRVPAPDAYRLKRARGLDQRRRRLPGTVKLLLAAIVILVGVVAFNAARGGVGNLLGALGTSFTGFFDNITATAEPSATSVIIADAPVIASPREPYTNLTTADLEVTVPQSVVGDSSVRVRVYLTLEGQEAAPVAEVPLSSTAQLVIPVELTPGRNDFSATIVEAGLESESSPVVTFILDTDPPVITLTSPKDGATINRETVTLQGTTQPRTTLLARNEANGTSVSAQAGSDGSFSMVLPLEPGPNGIRIAGTDPAGNAGELIIGLVRGNGRLTATLTASAYRISVKTLPVSMQMSVLVTDPDGVPLEGATVTFTLTAPGIPPVAKDTVTGGDGRATYTTTLPVGVTTGTGLATVLVASDAFGETSAQKPITFVE